MDGFLSWDYVWKNKKELNFVCAIVGKITRILSGMDRIG